MANIKTIFQFKNSLGISLILVFTGILVFIQGWNLAISLGITSLVLLISLYGLKAYLNDTITSITCILIFFIALSFVPFAFQHWIFWTFFSIILFGIFLRRGRVIEFIIDYFQNFQRNSIWNTLTWFFIFLILILGFYKLNLGFILYDSFHPLYELSIGNAFENSLVFVEDNSYVGKDLKYHFLSTRLPHLVSNLLGISLLESAHLVVRFAFTLLLFIVLNAFYRRYSEINTPIFLLFFLPVGLVVLLPESFFFRTIFASISFYSATLFLIVSIYLLLNNKLYWFYISAICLLFLKAPYFILLLFALILYSLRNKQILLHFAKLFLPLFVVLLLAYPIFFADAHTQNLWVLFPSYFSRWFFLGENFLKNLMGFLLMFFIVFLPALKLYLKFHFNKQILLFASLALVSFVIPLFISEITESNAYQFAIPGYFFGISCFYLVLKEIKFKKYLFCLIPIFLIWNFYLIYDLKISESIQSIKNQKSVNQNLDFELVETYQILQNMPKGVVLIPNFPSYGFTRSALSNQQFYMENYFFKGMIMEKDFSERLANIFFFYKNYSESLDEKSENKIQKFINSNPEKNPAIALSQFENTRNKILYQLAFKKDWSRYNISQKVVNEAFCIFQELEKNIDLKTWLDDFINKNKIKYIVFENGDQPSEFLLKRSKMIFQSKHNCILSIN